MKKLYFGYCFQTFRAWPFISRKPYLLKSVLRARGQTEMEVGIHAARITGAEFENQSLPLGFYAAKQNSTR